MILVLGVQRDENGRRQLQHAAAVVKPLVDLVPAEAGDFDRFIAALRRDFEELGVGVDRSQGSLLLLTLALLLYKMAVVESRFFGDLILCLASSWHASGLHDRGLGRALPLWSDRGLGMGLAELWGTGLS